MNKLKTLLLTLLLTTSFSTLAGLHLDFTLSGFCYKQPNVQDRGGVYYFPNEEVGITKSSLCVYKDAYGQYASKGKLIDGKKYGKWTEWYENGQKKLEGNYKDGKKDGKWNWWYEWGQKSFEGNYKDNKLNGKFTRWYENGQKELEGNYKDGKKDGVWTDWNENGHKQREGKYTDGKKNGKWTEWHPNAQAYFPKYTERNYEYDYCIDCNSLPALSDSGPALSDETLELLSLIPAPPPSTDELKSNYVKQIASRVKSYWRYQGAENHWNCLVYVLQSDNGTVESVNIQSCEIDDSAKAKSFKDSIERAVYKSSPLPTALYESAFDREIIFYFRVN